jgi:RNA polymerase sigma factor (sigma-70 family)|tara:strand:+ start:140 stop:901 length:762 start_codon:yes stop_codon:yes gene_type:complete
MKKYNIQNYIRYKDDVKTSILNLEGKMWDEYTRDELIVKFMPLVENLARKFSTTQQASGVMSINDLIQEGNKGLILAVDKLDWEKLNESEDIEKTLLSFLSKRIKGAIRRAIDINRGDMRVPEYKINEIRKNFGKDKKIVQTFFNQIFSSIDENFNSESEEPLFEVEDKSEPYNIALLNTYLLGIMSKYLNEKQYEVLRLSYGLDCDKHSAKDIAAKLDINGVSNYVRVSEIKKSAIETLIENVPAENVIDYL